MGSSFGLVIRAVVMLACLAVVPLVAMYGKYVPDFAQAVIEAYKSRTEGKTSADSRASGGEAPPFSGAVSRTRSSASTAEAAAGFQAGAPSRWNDGGSGARPLSEWPRLAPADATDSGGLKRASFDRPTGDSTRFPGAPASASSSATAPAGDGAGATTPPSNSPTGESKGPAADDCTTQFRRMEQRLRELGATYYLLETWGSSGDRYRFFCKMAIAGSADYNRNRIFQATAADPLRAMQDVLEQVEQWRAGKQP